MLILAACTRAADGRDPMPLIGGSGTGTPVGAAPTAAPILPTDTPFPTPAYTPTPDAPHTIPPLREQTVEYHVQPGDTLSIIARAHNVSVEAILSENALADPNLLSIGQRLVIPPPVPVGTAPNFKIVPDGEMVYGPALANFDIENYIAGTSGYIKGYLEEVNGELMNSAQIVQLVAHNYSVSPRLLLALLEHQGGWLSQAEPDGNQDFPMGLLDGSRTGLYRQLAWTADQLNRGFYLWRAEALAAFVTQDGAVVLPRARTNAGTIAVQYFFAALYPYDAWRDQVRAQGFQNTFVRLFGYPFESSAPETDFAALTQPVLQLPFQRGETWSFTGGPHGGWDSGSGWAALDFAPPGEPRGCVLAEQWTLAVADGVVLRAANGTVILDLDGDGFEQTGWVILYLHIDSSERVRAGTRLQAGDRIGHPSCEGGISSGTHLHIARRYNGEWIPAGQPAQPFVMDGWVPEGTGELYDGYLRREGVVVEAFNGQSEINAISR